ncbi:MAG: SRPBCC family protein [Candidatus Dormibacteria bacterium]
MSLLTWKIVVSRAAEDIFDYLADFSRHAEWSPRPFKIEPISGGPLQVGSRFRSHGSLPRDWREYSNDVEVTALDRPWRIAFAATEHARVFKKEHALTFENEFVLTPVGAGTEVERSLRTPSPPGVLGLVLPLLARWVIKPGVQAAMLRLKENVDRYRDQVADDSR